MMWRMVVRRADIRGHERVIVRVFDDDLKAIRYGMWHRFLAKFWGETVHVKGPQLVINSSRDEPVAGGGAELSG
jgi:hypothetical protein